MSVLKGLFKKRNALSEGAVELKFKAEPLVAVFKGDVKEKYVIDQAMVLIVDEGGRGFYLISEQESASVSEKRIELNTLPERPASRAIAEELNINHSTVVRAAKVVSAIRRYPALERLGSASDVQRVARVADNRLFGFTQRDVEAAVDLALREDVDPLLALYMQRIPGEQ